MVLISIFCYQGTITTFLAFSLLLLLLKNIKIKDFFINIGIVLCIIAGVSIFNLSFIKLIEKCLDLEQTRINYNIITNFLYILNTKVIMLVFTSNNFYKGMFITLLILLSTIYYQLFKQLKDRIYNFFIFILTIIISVDLPYLISLSGYNAGRTRFVIGALCSMVVILIFSHLNNNDNIYYKKIYKFLYSLIIIYFILNVINYIEIIANTKIVNECEKNYVLKINEYINEYEKNNNLKIEKI